MKKFLVLSLAGLLIMAMSSMVYAQKLDFRASGFIYTQTFYFKNALNGISYSDNPIVTGRNGLGAPSDYLPGGGAFDRKNAIWNSRARLKFDAVMGKELSGTIFFEMDSDKWGNTSGDRNKFGYWTADRASVEVKHVYIDVGVPVVPVPITARIGLQGAAVRPNMVLDTDGMGITAAIKVDPITIIPQYFKPWEGKDASADDVDFYSLEVKANLGTVTVGGYGLFANMNSYTVPTSISAYGSRSTYMAEMWWLGVYGEGKLGPVNFKLDFVMDRGEVEKKTSVVKDAKYRGWATRATVEVPVDKFVFGGSFLYGTGADLKKTSADGLPGKNVDAGSSFGQTTKVGAYVIPPGESGKLEESIVLFFGSTRTSSEPKFVTDDRGTMNRANLGGVWVGKLFFKFKVTPWYTADFGVMYLGDTTKNGNTIGNARKGNVSSGLPRDDSEIGIEVGLWNDFLIYKNLDFNVGLGYIFAGDAMDYWDSSRSKNTSPDNPWAINTRLRYRF